MEFLKQNDYWTYQIPEWDNYNREDIDSIMVVGYLMAPEKDLWTIRYKKCEFIVANDLVYGCEIRATNEEDLPLMEELIKNFNL